jgi:AcrR family transcriptional regulator
LSRPLRADAARNRARVLAAADEVFGDQGPGGSTEEVARRAGVGIATVFRHFPTKEALLGAVLVQRLRDVAVLATELGGRGDPETAFFDFFREAVSRSPAKLLLTRALEDAEVDLGGTRREVDAELRAAVGALLEGAQRAGTVRADVRVDEVFLLLAAASRAAELSRDDASLDRAVGVLLDGLRTR